MTFFLFTLVLGRFFHRSGSGFFRIGSGFLADPDLDSEKKSDPDPGKKPGSETLDFWLDPSMNTDPKHWPRIVIKGTVARDFCFKLRLWGVRLGPTDVTHPLLRSV